MTDAEREHLLGRIAALERRLRRWRLACLALLGLLLLPVALGGLGGVWWVPRLERERAERLELERDRDLLRQSERAREHQVYYQRILEAERQKAMAEEEARRRAQQGPRGRKD